ncbi:MAG: hypothetical protein KGO96_13880 [Elusimicrobia bacterium]|nr:hypothetical protein [Elusimicrobiota bacterium]
MNSSRAATSVNLAMLGLGAVLVLSQGWLQKFKAWTQAKVLQTAGAVSPGGSPAPTQQVPNGVAPAGFSLTGSTTPGGILSPATQAAYGALVGDLSGGTSTTGTVTGSGTVLT